MTNDELNTLNDQKELTFKKNLNEFVTEYNDAISFPEHFTRHSANCGNQARTLAEAFCRIIILRSDKPDGQKSNDIKGTLNRLYEKVTGSNSPYIDDEHERDTLKSRLKRMKDIGNNASHDNSIIITPYDLDEIKNNLFYFYEHLFDEAFVETNATKHQKAPTTHIENSIEDIEDSEVSIKNKQARISGSLKKIKNSTIRIG